MRVVSLATGPRRDDSLIAGSAVSGRRMLGAVLAGGHSTRMGRDKAGALVGDKPMLAIALDALGGLDERVVVGRPREITGVDPTTDWLHDEEPDSGPLGGILTALAWAGAHQFDAVVFLPCDLPTIRSDDVGLLTDAWERQNRSTSDSSALPQVAIAAGPERANWLACVVPVTALGPLRAAWSDGVRAPHRAFATVDCQVWEGPEPGRFVDADQPEDLNT